MLPRGLDRCHKPRASLWVGRSSAEAKVDPDRSRAHILSFSTALVLAEVQKIRPVGNRAPDRTAKYAAVQTELIPIDPILLSLTAYVAVNLGALVLYAADKRRARRRLHRIRERTLLLAALVGPVGALAGMSAFHHKTRKLRFVVAVPLFTGLHAAVIIALIGVGSGA